MHRHNAARSSKPGRRPVIRIAWLFSVLICTIVLFIPFSAIYGYYLAPEEMHNRVTSPDGRYDAQVGVRGFMDSINAHLYIHDNAEGKTTQAHCSREDDIAWSSDSRLVAVLAGGEISVLDPHNSREGDIWLLDPHKYMKYHRYPLQFYLEWLDLNTISIVAVHEFTPGRFTRERIAVANVKESGDHIQIDSIALGSAGDGVRGR